MMKTFREWFSEADNQTMCLVRALVAAGAVDMIYKFYTVASPSFQDFGIGLAAILAAVAAKQFTETK